MNNLNLKHVRYHQQRGTILFLVVIMMTVLLSFCAFSIDIGYLFMVKAQLQRAADAAALAGAAQLPTSSAAAITAAQQYANANMSGQGTILASTDIVIGTWNSATQTLTATTTNPTAISVKASRTLAKGNPVMTFFSVFLGITSTDVTASATAQIIYPTPAYNIIGMSNVTISGGATVDSYNSSVGPYSSSAAHNATIASNSNISISNGAIIYGDANPGMGKSTTVTGATVTGSTSPLTKTLSYAPAAAPTSYNNNGLGTQLIVTSSNDTNLLPGTYYFTNVNVSNAGTVTISGLTTIYISGSFSLAGGGIINTPANANDLNLVFTSTATTASFSNGSTFYGSVYGPSISLSITGGAALYGSFIANTFTLSNGVAVHLDQSVQLPFVSPVIKLVK